MYAETPPLPPRPAVTVPKLRQMKAEGERIAALTAYDASFARVLDAAGIDAVLVEFDDGQFQRLLATHTARVGLGWFMGRRLVRRQSAGQSPGATARRQRQC